MGQRKISGLYLRGGVWFIDKQVQGKRIRESTGSSDFKEAQLIFSKRIEEVRQAKFFGVRPKILFSDAAARYFKEELPSLRPRTQEDYVQRLKPLDQYIGQVPLEEANMGTLESYKQMRQHEGVSKRTINKGYEMVRLILNLATDSWVDEHCIPWLDEGRPLKTKINNTSWKKAKARVGLNKVRIHDMKHTFGNRLRAAGVSFEDRQDLLGHKSGRITTHYSTAQFENLVSAANKACIRNDDSPTTSILRILHDAA